VVNQRRMIDESDAGDEFKRVLRGKLDALLALAEATDCRRVRLLQYFGEASKPCMNCDNCLQPPSTIDATEAARKLLSCIYRVQQASGLAFGAGHLMDILRGKATDKVKQHGHEQLSTFGIGADWSETQWRSLLRQLIAREVVAVASDGFNTLSLTDAARPVLRGESTVILRSPRPDAPRSSRASKAEAKSDRPQPTLTPLQNDALETLRQWRRATAKARNQPAFVIFPDSTLLALAQRMPLSMDDLTGIPGMGVHKREAYGPDVLTALGPLLASAAA